MKKEAIFLLLFTIFFVFVSTKTFDPKLDLNGDNVQYLSLAKNISEGLGYSNVSPDGNAPASHFPPGYSFFLSLFMLLGINSLVFFKVLNACLLFGSLLGLFYLVSRITSNPTLALSSVVLAAFCPKLLEFSSMVMSEMLFVFCTILCFVALFRYSKARESGITCFWTSPWFYLSIVAAVSAYYIRTVGMGLIFALIVFFLFRKEWWSAVASLAGCVLLIMPWSLRNAYYGIESRYFGTIMTVNPWRPEAGTIGSAGEMFEKMLANFDETVIKGFKEILFPFVSTNYETGSNFFQIIVGLLILALVMYGAWNMGVLRWAFVAYLISQIGLFMLWHGGNGSRYVVPIAPLLFVCFYTGLYSLIRLKWKKESKFTASIPYAFLLMILFMFTPVEHQAKAAKMPHPPAYLNYFSIAREMEKHVPQNTVCCCRKPELFRYYAEKIYSVNYLYTTDANELLSDLVAKKVDYVVLEQLGFGSTPRYLYPAIQANPELFPVVWHLPNPDTYLLKFEREKAVEKLGL